MDATKEYYILLRSRGENFLREQIPYRIKWKNENQEEQNDE